jgi:hypothetical protein
MYIHVCVNAWEGTCEEIHVKLISLLDVVVNTCNPSTPVVEARRISSSSLYYIWQKTLN